MVLAVLISRNGPSISTHGRAICSKCIVLYCIERALSNFTSPASESH